MALLVGPTTAAKVMMMDEEEAGEAVAMIG
jgi:hypothetical protein